MACDLSAGRLVPCKDSVGGIKNVYFVDYGDIETYTLTADEITAMTGTFSAYKYELTGTNSLETSITSSPENGTTFFESTLTLNLQKLSKEDNVQVKLLAYGRPVIVVQTNNNDFVLVGKENGCSVSGGSLVTGAAFADMAGYTLTFASSEILPPNFVAGATELDPWAGSGATATVVLGTNS
jgi:hypothetical protein